MNPVEKEFFHKHYFPRPSPAVWLKPVLVMVFCLVGAVLLACGRLLPEDPILRVAHHPFHLGGAVLLKFIYLFSLWRLIQSLGRYRWSVGCVGFAWFQQGHERYHLAWGEVEHVKLEQENQMEWVALYLKSGEKTRLLPFSLQAFSGSDREGIIEEFTRRHVPVLW